MGALHEAVDALAGDLAGIRDAEHRRQAFIKHAAQLGVSRFAYLNTTQPGVPFHLETDYAPDWVARYTAQNYVAVDPVSLEAQRSRIPFQWRGALALPAHDRPQARLVFDEAATFGMLDGFTVPIHSRAGLSMMSLAIDDAALFTPKGAGIRHALHLLALQYHLSCERALCEPPPAPPPPRLSPREREVLLWTAKGKTGWEIAQILRLTERTVVYHVENAKAKLKAGSRSHAVVLALNLGLIDP